MPAERDLDLLVFGATGFTGRRVARRLVAEAGSELRVGLCARSPAKLDLLGIELSSAETIVADTNDPGSVRAAVERAHVVANCAGPFARLGDVVVDACVQAGTHYADITGETVWARSILERHDATAKQRGIALVPFCGFDSVPADLGVLRLVRTARERFGEGLRDVLGVYRLRGGLNGGTLASALEIASSADPRQVADPFLLVPEVEPSDELRKHHADPEGSLTEPGGDQTLVPFFMGPINRRVVMRSDYLLRYGADLRYHEYMAVGSLDPRLASLLAKGQRAALGFLGTRLGRAAAERFGPKPGEGPSEEAIQAGSSRLDLYAETESGHPLHLRFDADGDPGNRVTALCLSQGALALRAGEHGGQGGVLTPAAAFGERLLARLERTGEWRSEWMAPA